MQVDYLVYHSAGNLVQIDVTVTLGHIPASQSYMEQQFSIQYVEASGTSDEPVFKRSGNPGNYICPIVSKSTEHSGISLRRE